MSFPENFLWGAASSAPQIEGAWDVDGRTPSIWDLASEKKVKNGENCRTACDHYHRFREDVALMKELGLKSYRFSISWSRIIPSPGIVNEKGLQFYSDLVDELLASGIEPLVTLFHWDLPVWAHKKGGWRNDQIIAWFDDYVRIVVNALSDRVRYWITINEPQVFAMMGYVTGTSAPFEHHPFTFRKILRNVLLAHGSAVRVIRETAKQPPLIGLAMAATTYIPDGEDEASVLEAARRSFESAVGEGSNGLYMDPIALGRPPKMLRNTLRADDLAIISAPVDFIGVNVYQPSNNLFRKNKKPGISEETTMLGWTVDNRCLYWTIRHYYDRYHLPVMVTENGMASADIVSADGCVHDKQRSRFIRNFTASLTRAVNEGIPLLGYQYWSILDNFEWCEGYAPRFGLIHVEYKTQKRTIKDSARVYEEIIRTNGANLWEAKV